MNPSIKFILILLVSLEITFVLDYRVNLLVAGCAFIYLLLSKLSWRRYLLLIFLPVIPMLGAWTSFNTFSSPGIAWVMVTRILSYIYLGAAFSFTTDMDLWLDSLEQNFHLPTVFIYGLRGALSFVPRVKQEIKTIRVAALMRVVKIAPYSPQLFLKSILISLRWSERLSTAMISHGFTENAPRTHFKEISIKKSDIFIAGILIILMQFSLLFF
ncbi:energy-coupling factor transporter transmembrane component T [Oenococcus oeni]